MTFERCSWICGPVKEDDGVETFMTRRLVVVGDIPKRRNDSAICTYFVSATCCM